MKLELQLKCTAGCCHALRLHDTSAEEIQLDLHRWPCRLMLSALVGRPYSRAVAIVVDLARLRRCHFKTERIRSHLCSEEGCDAFSTSARAMPALRADPNQLPQAGYSSLVAQLAQSVRSFVCFWLLLVVLYICSICTKKVCSPRQHFFLAPTARLLTPGLNVDEK